MRYLRLYLHFIRFSFSRAFEFRVDFFFRIFMDGVFYLVNILFFKILYLHTESLGGFNEDQALIFVASFSILDALMMTIVANNMWWFPIFVNNGDLDYYLVRPISEKFFLSLRDFAANSFINLLMAFSLFAWAILRSVDSYPLINYFWFALMLLNGFFLNYLVRMAFILPVFWSGSGRGFDEVFWSLEKAMDRPDGIFTGKARKIFTTILPTVLMVSFPVRFLFDGFQWHLFGHILLVTFCFWLFYQWFWGKAVKNYSSASS